MNGQYELILDKLRKFCAYRDRSHEEVRSKLLGMKIYGHPLESIISTLIQEDFLNEERYALQFTSGKFRMNGWGWIKIKNHLKSKGVSEYNIRKAHQSLDESEYKDTLKTILNKKRNQIGGQNKSQITHKLIQYSRQKGFEYELIKEILDEWETM